MKYSKILIAAAFMAALASCTSTISMQDILAQEEEARSELQEAREEMHKLAEMKEQYSVDSKESRIGALNERKKTIRRDLGNLDGLESQNLDSRKENMMKGLQQEEQEIDEEIRKLEQLEKEEWGDAVGAINEKIDELIQQVNMITANLKGE